ncbi:polyhydroxyalkanoic acid system family protein [Erythrobacter alti]|uniref:polyhydroxyalkanoic acid system family protein n=1 Tax=Erythrobacter alti TaxID=1896145 RepID=UPI0030F48E02
MQVAIPHQLGREEVRRRLSENSDQIADHIPGGMAEVQTSWPSEDRMAMAISAMGQALSGHIDIEDNQVIFHMDLPPALGFLKPIVEGAIRQSGQKMLEPPKD